MKKLLFCALFCGVFGGFLPPAISSLIAAEFAPVLRAELAADFKQTINTSDGEINYYGSALLHENDWFWRISSPENKRICSAPGGALVIDDDLEQVQFVRKNIDIAQLVRSARSLGEGNFAAQIDGRDYFIKASTAGALQEIAYTDEFGAQVLIVFAPPAAPIARDCSVPAHYDEVAE